VFDGRTFLQPGITALNPGNPQLRPLVDSTGALIGVNTAVHSSGPRGSVVPFRSNTAHLVAAWLIQAADQDRKLSANGWSPRFHSFLGLVRAHVSLNPMAFMWAGLDLSEDRLDWVFWPNVVVGDIIIAFSGSQIV